MKYRHHILQIRVFWTVVDFMAFFNTYEYTTRTCTVIAAFAIICL
jgi:hypothetical protein